MKSVKALIQSQISVKYILSKTSKSSWQQYINFLKLSNHPNLYLIMTAPVVVVVTSLISKTLVFKLNLDDGCPEN